MTIQRSQIPAFIIAALLVLLLAASWLPRARTHEAASVVVPAPVAAPMTVAKPAADTGDFSRVLAEQARHKPVTGAVAGVASSGDAAATAAHGTALPHEEPRKIVAREEAPRHEEAKPVVEDAPYLRLTDILLFVVIAGVWWNTQRMQAALRELNLASVRQTQELMHASATIEALTKSLSEGALAGDRSGNDSSGNDRSGGDRPRGHGKRGR